MPIQVDGEIRVFSKPEFYELDERVLGTVFAVRNEFGRLLDEELFKRALARRCAALGIASDREVRIRVTHDTFSKDYFMDLLFERGMMVEAKAVESLTRSHRAQALSYLLLAGMKHGRLINFRPDRVQHEYVSTSLDPAERRNVRIADSEWREPNPDNAWLKQKVTELVRDWGAFLETALFREAIIHFLGGQDVAFPEIEILDGPEPLGFQRACLLCPDTALSFTAFARVSEALRSHYSRFLAHTRLQFVQWVNFNRSCIEFRTIARG